MVSSRDGVLTVFAALLRDMFGLRGRRTRMVAHSATDNLTRE
jgi:hypothetical protein